MSLIHYLKEMETIIPTSEQSIHEGIRHFKSKVAYSAPELMGGLWHRVYEELILPKVAPRDTEPWGDLAFECWNKYVHKRKKEEP